MAIHVTRNVRCEYVLQLLLGIALNETREYFL